MQSVYSAAPADWASGCCYLADHKVKTKESDKIDKNVILASEKKKTVEYEDSSDTSCIWCPCNGPLRANKPNQTETLLHSLERAAAGIGLHVNAHKTEFMCFNQKGDLSETGWQIHLPRKQRPINRKRHRHTANEGMDSYR